MRRHILLALALLFIAPGAWAAARTCTAVAAACDADSDGYCEFSDSDTWGAAAPTAADSATVTAPCKVECNTGTCATDTFVVTGAGAELKVDGGAVLDGDNCDDTGASRPDAACGAQSGGKLSAQGTLLIDSTVHDLTWSTSQAIGSDGDTIKMNPGGTVVGSAGGTWPVAAPAAGDWFQLTSGADKHAVYRVEAVNFSGCPTAGSTCEIDLSLYDGGMSYANIGGAGWGVGSGTGAVDTTNRKTLMRAMNDGGAAVAARQAYIAGPNAAGFSTAAVSGYPTPLDRCIEVCTTETLSNDYQCTASNVLAANGDYIGWRLQLNSALPGAAAGFSAIVTSSFNDVTLSGAGGSQATDGIADGGAVVDRLCFDTPIPSTYAGSTTLAANLRRVANAILTPPLQKGDSFKIWRPATISASGTEWDSGLAARDGGIFDFDYAFLSDWASIFADGTGITGSDLSPFVNVVIVHKAIGGGAGVGSQNNPSNGRVVWFDDWTNLSIGPIALIDDNTPHNTGATGTNSSCPDESPYDGACDAGGVSDTDATSGTHGMELEDSSGTITGLYCRYLGDDCVTTTTAGAGIAFVEPYGWWTALGASTEFLEVFSPMTVTNARSYAYPHLDTGTDACDAVIKTGNNSALTTLNLSGLISVQLYPTKHVNNASTFSGSQAGSSAMNVAGRVQVLSGDCPSFDGIGRVKNSWAFGNSQVAQSGVSLDSVYAWLGTGTSTSPITNLASVAAKTKNSAIVHIPNLIVLNDAVATSQEITDSLFEWAADSSAAGIGNWANTDSVLAGKGLRNNIVVGRPVLQCAGTTWGPANDDLIGNNYVVSATASTAGLLIDPSNCPSAAAQYGIAGVSANLSDVPIRLLSAGPTRSGVPDTAPIMDFLPSGTSFQYGVLGGGGGSPLCPAGLQEACR